jgi:hypothetical protein
MKNYSLFLFICLIISLHWYSSKTEKMVPKRIIKEKTKTIQQKNLSQKDFNSK